MLNRVLVTRLVPLTASVAIHAALVAVALSLVEPPAPPGLPLDLVAVESPPTASAPPPPVPDESRRPARSEPARSRVPARPATPVEPPAESPPPVVSRTPPDTAAPPAVASAPVEAPPTASVAPATDPGAAAAGARPAPPTPASPGGPGAGAPAGARTTTAPNAPATAGADPGAGSSVGGAVASLPASGVTQRAIPRGGYQVKPTYPATARRLGIEGTTLLGVLVDDDGRVAEIVVRQSAGHPDLDRAATDAVRRWRFEPARRGTEAVAMWVVLPVEFRLR